MACFFGHKWDGCKCKKCGKTRDEQHDFDLCKGKCKRCGKTQVEQHDWQGCKCTECGKTRDEQHDFNLCKGKCKRCGKTQAEQHNWEGCKCKKCGKIRNEQHDWIGCKCSRCGNVRDEQHDWDGCICKNCGKATHGYSRVEGKCLEKCSACGKERLVKHDFVNGKCTICGEKRCTQHKFQKITPTKVKCSVCSLEKSGDVKGKHIVEKVQDNPWVYRLVCLICGQSEKNDSGDRIGNIEKLPCINPDLEITPSINIIATTVSLSMEPNEDVTKAEKYLISQGSDAYDSIVLFLLSCASGQAGKDWWYGADRLFDLLLKFNNRSIEATLVKIGTVRSNIHEYTRIRKMAQAEMNKRNGGVYCPFYIKSDGKCAAGGYMYSCSANPSNYENCNVFMVNPF